MRQQRRGTPIRIGGVTITPVAEVRLEVGATLLGLWIRGAVRPVAVLIDRDGREERIELTRRE